MFKNSKRLKKDLGKVLDGLESDEFKQIEQKVAKLRADGQVQNHAGKLAKADRIEQAVYAIPVEKRGNAHKNPVVQDAIQSQNVKVAPSSGSARKMKSFKDQYQQGQPNQDQDNQYQDQKANKI